MKTYFKHMTVVSKIVAVVAFFVIATQVHAWTAPTTGSPSTANSRNVVAPLTTSNIPQEKLGILGVMGGFRSLGTGWFSTSTRTRNPDGSAWPRSNLMLAVNGSIGARAYCDENGGNCRSVTALMVGPRGPAGPSAPVMPSGAVMPFSATSCPDGWSYFSEAEGRYIVGANSPSAVRTTRGTRLDNEENRPTGEHGTHVFSYQRNMIDTAAMIEPRRGTNGQPLRDGNNRILYTHRVIFYQDGKNDFDHLEFVSADVDLRPNNMAAIYEGVPGTNAPYIQFLYCRKN